MKVLKTKRENLVTTFIIIKPGSRIPLTNLQRSCRLELSMFGDLFWWVPRASAMDCRHTQIGAKCKSKLIQCRCMRVCCICRWCSNKMFSLPTTANNRRLVCEVELSSTSQARWPSIPGTDYDLVIYVHICHNSVPVCASDYSVCPGYVSNTWEPSLNFKQKKQTT